MRTPLRPVAVVRLATVCVAALCVSCTPAPPAPIEVPATAKSVTVYQSLENHTELLESLVQGSTARTLGVALIRDGTVVDQLYLGDQAAGVSAGPDTLFNTASMQKTVTAETVLRLHMAEMFDLDAPLSDYFVHPDLSDDPRHRMLTARTVLGHRTGLRNWAYEYDTGQLSFDVDPGTRYGYSGAGFMILARAVEEKLGEPWPEIVQDTLLDPLGLRAISMRFDPDQSHRMVQPVDASGTFIDWAFQPGEWNAADDLWISVADYADLLIAVAQDDGPIRQERIALISDLREDAVWGCQGLSSPCPNPWGHGLGWFIMGRDGRLTLQHGGNDHSEAAIGYITLDSGDGAVVFLNAPAPNGVKLWPKVVDIIDPDQTVTPIYHHVIARFLSEKPE